MLLCLEEFGFSTVDMSILTLYLYLYMLNKILNIQYILHK